MLYIHMYKTLRTSARILEDRNINIKRDFYAFKNGNENKVFKRKKIINSKKN